MMTVRMRRQQGPHQQPPLPQQQREAQVGVRATTMMTMKKMTKTLTQMQQVMMLLSRGVQQLQLHPSVALLLPGWHPALAFSQWGVVAKL